MNKAEIIAEFRKNVCDISDEEVEDIVSLCIRKMKLTGQPEEYLELLLPDELKNYVIRRAVNTATFLRQTEKGCTGCVAYV